jgi:hypothetical protein
MIVAVSNFVFYKVSWSKYVFLRCLLQVPIEIEIEIEICGNTKLLHEAQQATCVFLCLERKVDHMRYFLRLCIKLACMTSTITNDFCSENFCHFFITKKLGKNHL